MKKIVLFALCITLITGCTQNAVPNKQSNSTPTPVISPTIESSAEEIKAKEAEEKVKEMELTLDRLNATKEKTEDEEKRKALDAEIEKTKAEIEALSHSN